MRTAVLLTLVASLVACGDKAAAPAETKPAPAAEPAPKGEPVVDAAVDAPAAKASSQIVELPLGDDLPKLLAEHAVLAKQANLTPFVELWAQWCGPCKKLEAAMGDERIAKAFAGVYLIRLNSDAWGPKLGDTGLDNSAIPVFYELDAEGKTTGRKIDGGAWGEDIPENMAPPLDAFFHGTKS